jgi:hypothetical protein
MGNWALINRGLGALGGVLVLASLMQTPITKVS